MSGSETFEQHGSSGTSSSKSKSFQFDLAPEQKALVDSFMNETYPEWKTALQDTSKQLGAINAGAAADWGKQKAMIGGAQVPVNFTAGGGTLASWVPYRTSMGNAIDKEAGYKSEQAKAGLIPSSTLSNFYSETVAPMQRQRQASLGSQSESSESTSSSGSSQSMGYIDMFNPSNGRIVSVPAGEVGKLTKEGWGLGTPDPVTAGVQMNTADNAANKALQKNQLEAAEPGLMGTAQQIFGLVRAGSMAWNDPTVQGGVAKVKAYAGDQGVADIWDSSHVSTDAVDYGGGYDDYSGGYAGDVISGGDELADFIP
jgi:hypothetical protein